MAGPSPAANLFQGINMRYKEKLAEMGLSRCALSSILIIAIIFSFIVNEGLPVISRIGLVSFLTGMTWNTDYSLYGILPMVLGTLIVTALSLLLGLPLGLGCAVLLAEIAPAWARNIMKPAIETLARIPSVVYGFFGLIIIVPFIMNFGPPYAGTSVLACGIVLAIMILPTIISVSEDAIRAVPRDYREGALAIGATKWQTIYGMVVPAARSGILAGAILAMGRSIGETMAVLMVGCGSPSTIPTSILSPVATMTAVIAGDFGYATVEHRSALFAIGIVLMVIIMALNLIVYVANRKKTFEGV